MPVLLQPQLTPASNEALAQLYSSAFRAVTKEREFSIWLGRAERRLELLEDRMTVVESRVQDIEDWLLTLPPGLGDSPKPWE